MTVLFVNSSFDGPSETVRQAAMRGDVTIVDERGLTAETLLAHAGLITGNQLDQNAMLKLKPALAAFLDAGGRWFFNGHMVRPLVDGIGQYRPIATPGRRDFDLASVTPHPVWDGIDLRKIETNKGVAGFYGRGCNPPPPGAVTLNGLGAAHVPVDWVWSHPGGGRFLSHSGNDLAMMGLEWNLAPELTRRIIAWANGGPCLDPWPASPHYPARDELPLAAAEHFGGMRTARKDGRRIVTPTAGTYYHIRSLEGPAYTHAFNVICTPEDLPAELTPRDILWVPCRMPASRMIAVRETVRRHLDAGGMAVALGESRSDLWLPAVTFTAAPTNWWWWLDPAADLGVTVTAGAAGHPLMRDIGKQEVTWHLHGWFDPPEGATVLARDGEQRAILYEDSVSTAGTMIVSSLDPMFHHGSHFMPATTRFLDRFVPNLRAFADA